MGELVIATKAKTVSTLGEKKLAVSPVSLILNCSKCTEHRLLKPGDHASFFVEPSKEAEKINPRLVELIDSLPEYSVENILAKTAPLLDLSQSFLRRRRDALFN